jgi:hypothetical protein
LAEEIVDRDGRPPGFLHGNLRVAPFLLAFGLSVAGLAGAADSAPSFSHQTWSAVLHHLVDGQGRVDYSGLARNRAEFDGYLNRIAREGPKSTPAHFRSPAAKLAFYLNAYNAMVFEGVLERGPEKESVWSGGLISGRRFFVSTKFRLDGSETSLKSLEDDVIRSDFRDPRVHAALNCASLGCPRLPREAFDPERLDEQLDAAMTEFVEEERNVAVAEAQQTITLSRIFDWFKDDFVGFERKRGSAKPSVVGYVNRYRKSKPALDPTYRIRFAEYDKRINSR